jgi:hypothetical protein
MPNSPSVTTSQDSPRYTIVIPAYNEAQRISPTLDHILAHAADQRWSLEVIVVDDGSSDDTAEVVSRYGASGSAIRLIKNSVHRGKGHCVRTGVMSATGDLILVMDADLPAFMDQAVLLFQTLARGADIAVGSRWLRPDLQQVRQSLKRRHLGRCFNLFVRLVLGLGFADTQCGFKAFNRRAASLTFRFQNVTGWAFDAELLVIAESLGLAVEEVPVRIRHDSRSKLRPVLHGIQMLADVLQIACRRLFGKYPSAAAPPLQQHAGMARRSHLWPLLMPGPARIGFAMLMLLTSSMLMHDIAPVVGSTRPSGDPSLPLRQTAQSIDNSGGSLQSFVPDGEQISVADGSGDAFGE